MDLPRPGGSPRVSSGRDGGAREVGEPGAMSAAQRSARAAFLPIPIDRCWISSMNGSPAVAAPRRRAYPAGGCTACCHGPFDISAADAELVSDAVGRLPAGERDTAVARATAVLDRMRAIEPGWTAPYDVAAIGEGQFDRLTEALADEPCPLLDDTGRCRIYADRPLVCRLIGLGMTTPAAASSRTPAPSRTDSPATPICRRFRSHWNGSRRRRWNACEPPPCAALVTPRGGPSRPRSRPLLSETTARREDHSAIETSAYRPTVRPSYRFSLAHNRNSIPITRNMYRLPGTHMSSPPSCWSSRGDSPHMRGAIAYQG
jgi:Predicted Fe-S-cluster oxidoreductase